jgi:transcription initiation factor TFIID subunit 2
MLTNSSCRLFNGPSEAFDLANKMEMAYWREWPKAVSPKMTPEERKAMGALLNRAMREPASEWFRVAGEYMDGHIPGGGTDNLR